MQTVESLAQNILELQPCSGDRRHANTILPMRLHLARGPNDAVELFIEGNRASFGLAVVGHSLEWGRYHDMNSSREFEALVVRTSENGSSVRLMAHLAYEAIQVVSINESISNAELIKALAPFIALVTQRSILDVNHQMGLTAELLFLLELLNFVEELRPPGERGLALDAWKGWDSANRDFMGNETAIEVKSTSQDGRRHSVSSMYQLLPDSNRPNERVYVFSVGLKVDRSYSFRMLTAYDRVAVRLDETETEKFLDQLSRYGSVGFDPELRAHYELEPGFFVNHPPALFRVDNLSEILRPESYVGGSPPARAKRIRYEVNLDGLQPCSTEERELVMRDLLQRQ